MLRALVTLAGNRIEGISFVLLMLDDKLVDIILSLPDNHKANAKKVTCVGLLTSDRGAGLRRSWSPQSSMEILQIGSTWMILLMRYGNDAEVLAAPNMSWGLRLLAKFAKTRRIWTRGTGFWGRVCNCSRRLFQA